MGKKKSTATETLGLRGFFRLEVVNPDGSVAARREGHNIVVDGGFFEYLVKAIRSSANCGSITHVALGSGTVPNATHTTLNSEVGASTLRTTITWDTTSSKSARALATWNASWNTNMSGSTAQLNNIGLFNHSSAGTMFSGATYTQATCSSNQAVNVTYTIAFATA